MSDQHKVSKAKTKLTKGQVIRLDNGDYLLKEFLSKSEVLLVKLDDSKTIEVVKLSDIITAIVPADTSGQVVHDDILAIPKKDLKTAKERLKAIEPLLELGSAFKVRDAKIQAAKVSVHYNTLLRWLKSYNATQSLVSLAPRRRGWNRDKTRVDEETDQIINHCIDNFYLTKARMTPKAVYLRVKEACENANLKPPSQSTVYRRISRVPEERRLRARGHTDIADNRFLARAGKFPGADTILSVVQIDHTPLDIIIVDDEQRESIKRVWLTMAIDVYSRMVTGFYLSLDAPSTLSVAMCLSHSIIPKENWLKHLNLDLEWLVWGIPKKVHVDNGADFTSDTLRLGCMENNINLEFRPVAKPRWGGHIERLLGTFQQNLKDLDGKTFNNPKARGSYDSEKNAIFNFEALEHWLINAIVGYHHEKHDVLGVPPATKWSMAVYGELDDIPHGWPDLPSDPLSIELSFLPYERRTIRSQGIVWDGLYYFSDNIRHLIGAYHPETKKPKQFIIRRDPRNIKRIWVYDDKAKIYLKVPYADPSISFRTVWELREAKAYLKQLGQTDYNQSMLSRALSNMKRIEDESRKATTDARRKAQRDKNHKKSKTPAAFAAIEPVIDEKDATKSETRPTPQDEELWDEDIDDFDIE
ncbi:putative transposase [Idiomarina aquatica]|uniref:Putative transposase n=1 Tax=Idiomarina aquatica TaxID=1327752 RepID=A0A4R6P011_9GAMM|nr:Mu transposase C-terminal domain-containing protein [Idiomarina aquatica]TDP30777.1 putative transposase [Idiomarina aquatica]